ncbi:MAG: hypothetical protein M1594_01955 [Candidatus Marsarchaeota archaeon]|nr:hypothetical protein [Candidatus Marsarchaeota archaeon]
MRIFALNKEYNLVKDVEEELVEKKLRQEEDEIKRFGKRYLSEKEAPKRIHFIGNYNQYEQWFSKPLDI